MGARGHRWTHARVRGREEGDGYTGTRVRQPHSSTSTSPARPMATDPVTQNARPRKGNRKQNRVEGMNEAEKKRRSDPPRPSSPAPPAHHAPGRQERLSSSRHQEPTRLSAFVVGSRAVNGARAMRRDMRGGRVVRVVRSFAVSSVPRASQVSSTQYQHAPQASTPAARTPHALCTPPLALTTPGLRGDERARGSDVRCGAA